jgi:glutamate synthase (NADPH/NADH) small chain
VTLYEKNEKPGGLLRYGIPDFKLSKVTIDRRLKLMIEEGLEIRTDTEIGKDMSGRVLLNIFDALCIATGAMQPRDLEVDGRHLDGIHFAMDFLSQQNRVNDGQVVLLPHRISAEGLKVLVIGGGDTGSDCVGTAIRQKAKSVTQIEILPQPPATRTIENPWPFYGKTLKTTTSHEEGCERLWNISTIRFTGRGQHITGVEVEDVKWENTNENFSMQAIPETQRVIATDLVVLALGFVHPILEGLITELELELDSRKSIKVNKDHSTSIPKVFAAGDVVNGASLVVNAIASGRKAAEEIDRFLNK